MEGVIFMSMNFWTSEVKNTAVKFVF